MFLANPDNPTGVYASRDELARLCRALPPHVILVVDEAYHEYATAPDSPDEVIAAEVPGHPVFRLIPLS